MPQFFIGRPIFAWVIAILICLGGAIALSHLPIDSYPEVAPPQVIITANYPGANAKTVESTVTQVIEQQLTGIDNLLYFTSQSSYGQSQITLTFATGTDPDIAEVHVRSWQGAYRDLVPGPYLAALSIPERTERWTSILSEAGPDGATFVALIDGRIVGFANVGRSRDDDAGEGTGELMSIYLLPEQVGMSLGRALLARAVDALRTSGFRAATLWVFESNARARRFYEAAGWSFDGTRTSFELGGATLSEVRYRSAL